MAKTFFDCSKDFFIAVRTSCPNRIGASLGYSRPEKFSKKKLKIKKKKKGK
jgi:hypothetical protein